MRPRADWIGARAGRPPPSMLVGALSPPSDPLTREWMARNLMDEAEVIGKAWSAFLVVAIVGVLSLIVMSFLIQILELLVGGVAAACSPFIISSHIANGPARMARRESRAYLRHAPAVVGAMAMSMNLSPSLERAVVFASGTNRDLLGQRLAQVSWDVLTRAHADVESSISDLASSLDHGNQALRQSLHLLVASSHEPTKEGMEALTEKAHEVSVHGLKQAAERYVAGLSTPVMIIFALGILLPIMLLSTVPLFAMGGPLPTGALVSKANMQLPLAPLALLLLGVVPLACLYYCRSLLETSPTASIPGLDIRFEPRTAWPWMLWLSCLLALVLYGLMGTQPHLFLLVLGLPPSALLLRGRRVSMRRSKGEGPERDFIVGLYQLGNRLSSGTSLEKAMAEAAAASSNARFSDWSRKVMHLARVRRFPLEDAMEESGPISSWPLLTEAFRTIARCAQGDGPAAGRVAVRLAKSLGDIRDCEEGIQERLKGVVDMMRSTSLVFAPIVLGVTVGLFGLTSSFTGNEGAIGWVTLMAGVYIIELAFVVSFLTTFLSGGRTWDEFGLAFATRMPVAVLAFTSVSLLSHAGFARWW